MGVLLDGSAAYYLGGLLNTAQVTWSVWVKPSALPAAFGGIVGFQDSTGAHDKTLHLNSAGQVVWFCYDGTNKTVTSATTLPLGRWSHVAATADGTNMRLFINGRADGSAACGNTFTTYAGDTLRVGGGLREAGSTTSRYLNGAVAAVGLWAKALTGAQVAAVAAGAPPFESLPGEMVAFWRFLYAPTSEPDEWGLPAGTSGTFSGATYQTRQAGSTWPNDSPVEGLTSYVARTEAYVSSGISAPLIPSTTTLYEALIAQGRPALAPFIASTTALYTPTVSRNISPALLASATVLYTPTVRRSSIPVPLISSTTQVLPARLARTLTNVSLPTISGVAQQGQTLVASPGTWSGTEPISYAYQWQRCGAAEGSVVSMFGAVYFGQAYLPPAACANISGATASNYVVTAADVGSTIRIEVTASY